MTDGPPLTLPYRAGPAIADEVRFYGGLGVETGGFLLAAEGRGSVTIVAFAGESGITRQRRLFQVSALGLDALFGFAEDRGCWVPAQFHSHLGEAFLSLTDQQHGLRVNGFASAVVPDFADPPASPTGWSWWRFAGDRWAHDRVPVIAEADLELVVFDEDGVRGK